MLGTLSLVCVKCTRESEIQAATMAEAVEIAKARGWVMQDGKYICPTCPAVRYCESGEGVVIGSDEYRRAIERVDMDGVPEGSVVIA